MDGTEDAREEDGGRGGRTPGMGAGPGGAAGRQSPHPPPRHPGATGARGVAGKGTPMGVCLPRPTTERDARF